VKYRAFPGLTLVPDALRLRSTSDGLTPISRATEASCASVSCSVPACSTDASMVQCFRGVSMVSESGLDRSFVGVAGPELSNTEDPRSWSRLYSMPFTFANSRSSTMDMSRWGNSTTVEVGDVGLPGLEVSTPRSASSEYVMPLTCSTRRPSMVPRWRTVPSAGLTWLRGDEAPQKCKGVYLPVQNYRLDEHQL